ncbi:transaldolase [Dictyobacter alpinus]|uniref:Transaldolase n=1 Tax=Dictyobacter alpinus TaxID=2014873 RepID=A0A402B1A6_9CHLR|nr:transaldolase [Dictyobacter alpinus]GCE25126.1 transaldolase [Dictyobacter alpinus]
MKNRLAEVSALGQSPWYDTIARDQIQQGTFQRLIEQDAIVGVTSNPSLFQKAMTTGSAYDEQFRDLAAQQLDALSIYQIMANQDIQNVLAIFRPVYDRTHGIDGYVSLEVSPLLAYETQKTIDEAKQLWAHLHQPNLCIKIPGIAQGIPALEACIAEGINVNVTLIFSLAAYEQVILAYLSGLEKLAASGTKPLHQVASVASFFISRVDTLVDHLLEEKIAATVDVKQQQQMRLLKGKAAIANAKLAYQLYRSYFVAGPKSERFKLLQAQGAQVQRPLWASTGTKNPAYRDVVYVEELIGSQTVNTMPPTTIVAFQDHGRVAATVEQGVAAAQQVMLDLDRVGIAMTEVTDQLEKEGVATFKTAFEDLLQKLDDKRRALAQQQANKGDQSAEKAAQSDGHSGEVAGANISSSMTAAENLAKS